MGWLIFAAFMSTWIGSAAFLRRKIKVESWIITIGGSFLISIILLLVGFFVFEKSLTNLLIVNVVTAVFIYLDTRNLCFQGGITKYLLVKDPRVLAAACVLFGILIYPIFLYHRNDYVAELVRVGHIQKPNETLLSWLSGMFKSTIKNIALGAAVFTFIGLVIFYIKNRDDMNDSAEVKMVKSGSLQACPTKTIKQVVDSFLGDPKWTATVISTSDAVVNVRGEMTFYDKKVSALVQFKIDKANKTFSFSTFEMNDIPQATVTSMALIQKMCDSAK